MLLIDCPYCGERPEPEFVYGGQAHIARPPQPADTLARRSGPTTSTGATTRAACTPSAGATRTAAAASSTRCATRPPTTSSPPTRSASRRRAQRAGAPVNDGLRTAAGGRIDRTRVAALHASTAAPTAGLPATRSPRRCSRTACTSWAARSSTTARAACSPPAPRSPTRWSAVRRDAARYTPNLRATQVELYEGLEADSQNRWPSLGVRCRCGQRLCSPRSFRPGFYYKTFMWPRRAWQALYEPRIRAAAGLGRAPTQPTRTATPRATRTATCWSSAPARRASPPRWRPPRAGARVILCDEQAEFGGSLLSEPRSAPSHRRPRRHRSGCARPSRRSPPTRA